jgi:HNH endonuclease
MIVNHMDHDKYNNDADNLEWCTPAHNSQMAALAGAMKGKAVVQLSLDGTYIAEYVNMHAAARAVPGAHDGSIRHCCEGVIKKSSGFIWKYKL